MANKKGGYGQENLGIASKKGGTNNGSDWEIDPPGADNQLVFKNRLSP